MTKGLNIFMILGEKSEFHLRFSVHSSNPIEPIIYCLFN